MISQQTLQGCWNEIKGKLRSKWGALTDDDFGIFNGNVEQLMGMIQRRTGEARDRIEDFFDQLHTDSSSAMNRAGESVRSGAQYAADSVRHTSQQAAAGVREGVAEVEGLVRHRPAQSLVVCFGAGVITGILASLLLKRPNK